MLWLTYNAIDVMRLLRSFADLVHYPAKRKPRNKSGVLMRPQGRRLAAAARILITQSRGSCQEENIYIYHIDFLRYCEYFGITEGARETHRSSKEHWKANTKNIQHSRLTMLFLCHFLAYYIINIYKNYSWLYIYCMLLL